MANTNGKRPVKAAKQKSIRTASPKQRVKEWDSVVFRIDREGSNAPLVFTRDDNRPYYEAILKTPEAVYRIRASQRLATRIMVGDHPGTDLIIRSWSWNTVTDTKSGKTVTQYFVHVDILEDGHPEVSQLLTIDKDKGLLFSAFTPVEAA